MAAFAIGMVGCNSSTVTPTLVLSPTPPVEDLPQYFAQTVAAGMDVAGYQERIIIYSQVLDEKYLWFGVSQKKDDMRQCWLYRNKVLSGCSPADIERAFYVKEGSPPVPKMFFAVAYADEKEVIVILDYKHYRSTEDPIDGFRYVLQLNNGKWQVKSWTQVY